MIDTLTKIMKNEDPQEVVLMLTRKSSGISLPVLDRFYNSAGWPYIEHNLGLFEVLQKMRESGLIEQSGVQVTKGPQWREATFMLENKYPSE